LENEKSIYGIVSKNQNTAQMKTRALRTRAMSKWKNKQK